MRPRSIFTLFLLCAAAGAALFFLADRLACLGERPFKSAIQGWDNTFYYFWLRAPMVHGDFDFRKDAAATRTLPEAQRRACLASPVDPITGLPRNSYGVGWAVSSLPFYLLADGAILIANHLLGAHVPRDGYGATYQLFLFLGQFAYAVAALFLAWRIVRRWVPEPEAGWGVLLCWLGSFLFLYQTSVLTMAHNIVFFALTACFLCALRLREAEEAPASPWLWAGMGAAAGLAVISRYQTAVYLLFPAWAALGEARRWRHGVLGRFFLGLASFGGLVFLQLLAWKTVFGHWLVYSYQGSGFDWLHPRIEKVLFSSYHGLFYWSPALLFGFAGFCGWSATRQGRSVGGWWMASFLATLYVNATWECWWFGASYGSRAFEGSVLFFMLGTAWLLRLLAGRRLRIPALVVLSVLAAANVNLSYQARKNRLSMVAPVTHAAMWRALWESAGGGGAPPPSPRQ